MAGTSAETGWEAVGMRREKHWELRKGFLEMVPTAHPKGQGELGQGGRELKAGERHEQMQGLADPGTSALGQEVGDGDCNTEKWRLPAWPSSRELHPDSVIT